MGTGNVVAPSGNLYTQGQMPLVPTNAMVADPQEMGNIPIQPGKNVYIRDVATIQDTTDINYGCALVNGRRSIYIPVVKKDTASTLTVVQQIHDSMPLFQSVVPEDVSVRYEFDESPTVRAAIKSVATEGGIGALLTGLMILIFLRDVRTVIVVVVGIPLALTAALVGLWLTGNTINIMSLGGLALSIGILVDMAIVTVENTHVQMRHTESVARAVRRSDAATVTSRLLAMLCILSVFIPTFLMQEPVRSLFMPLTVAVGFAMIAAFLMSSSVVPVLSRLAHPLSGRRARRQEGLHRADSARLPENCVRDDPVPLDRGAGVPGGLRPAALVGRQAGRHRIVSPGGFRPVRDPFSEPSGLGV